MKSYIKYNPGKEPLKFLMWAGMSARDWTNNKPAHERKASNPQKKHNILCRHDLIRPLPP